MHTLSWSSKFALREAFTMKERGGGIYLWGFEGQEGDVIWYVGKAIGSTGVVKRLRKHYLDVMSGQYQIPKGFLNGKFISPDCSTSGWALRSGNLQQAAILQDWSKMQTILQAGHSFANCAFARTAVVNAAPCVLSSIERKAIHQLAPIINNQRAESDLEHLEMVEATSDQGWVQRWCNRHP